MAEQLIHLKTCHFRFAICSSYSCSYGNISSSHTSLITCVDTMLWDSMTVTEHSHQCAAASAVADAELFLSASLSQKSFVSNRVRDRT